MIALPYRLERTVNIRATQDTVFRFFTDGPRWASWWGEGSTIDPRPGGTVYIRHRDGTEARGRVLEISSPDRISFTYGYPTGTPIPPDGSRVSIRLEASGTGTQLHLTHEFADENNRDENIQGWRYQLSVFANVVANEIHAAAADVVDAFFAAWEETDDALRAAAFSAVAVFDVEFRDAFSLVTGQPDLIAHTKAFQRFMPGIRMRRRGDVRQCQGVVVADWVGLAANGDERLSGSHVSVHGPDSRIESATRFVNAASAPREPRDAT